MGVGTIREFGQIRAHHCIWDGSASRTLTTLLSVTWQPGWEGSFGENGYMCMIESLRSSPETITTLFVNRYTPVQNKKSFKNVFVELR